MGLYLTEITFLGPEHFQLAASTPGESIDVANKTKTMRFIM
jgi:hypothetical protein